MGHHAGDILLKKTAGIIQQCIRKSDTFGINGIDAPDNLAARHGGDEFGLIFSKITSPENAAIVARKLLEVIRHHQIIENNEISVTASIGSSIYPEKGFTAPYQFIAIAEDCGLIVDSNKWVNKERYGVFCVKSMTCAS